LGKKFNNSVTSAPTESKGACVCSVPNSRSLVQFVSCFIAENREKPSPHTKDLPRRNGSPSSPGFSTTSTKTCSPPCGKLWRSRTMRTSAWAISTCEAGSTSTAPSSAGLAGREAVAGCSSACSGFPSRTCASLSAWLTASRRLTTRPRCGRKAISPISFGSSRLSER
jgi:hypothetical protein